MSYHLFSSQDIDECESNPCKNGAKCENLENAFKCNCKPGWTGLTCEQGKNNYHLSNKIVTIKLVSEPSHVKSKWVITYFHGKTLMNASLTHAKMVQRVKILKTHSIVLANQDGLG